MLFQNEAVKVAVVIITIGMFVMSAGLMHSENSLIILLAWGIFDGALIYAATYPCYRLLGNVISEMWIIYAVILVLLLGICICNVAGKTALPQFTDSLESYREMGRVFALSFAVWFLKPKPPVKRNKRGFLSRELERLMLRLRAQLKTVRA